MSKANLVGTSAEAGAIRAEVDRLPGEIGA